MGTIDRRIRSSFRDPSGFLFYRDGTILRQVNLSYKEEYEHLLNSGLYDTLVEGDLLIPHREEDVRSECDGAYKVIRPDSVTFISYPYEWCFSQLKAAALTTLRVQKIAIEYGMSLKDCSAYNIQFSGGKPILIDSLSFERLVQGRQFVGYRQFCQHFLAPLLLMSYRDVRLNQLLRIYIDGVPLDLTSVLLPRRTRLSFSLYSHIHLHAKSEKLFAGSRLPERYRRGHRFGVISLVENLESLIRDLTWKPSKTAWTDYYDSSSYSAYSFDHKKQLVEELLDKLRPRMVWDLGSNTGQLSRIASGMGIETISFDSDPACVEMSYRECVREGETHLLPLVLDLTNPSPAIGWNNEERATLAERGPTDTILALALLHHLAIGNNVPFDMIASSLSSLCSSLVIEFIPKDDPQVQRLLSSREDVFSDYDQDAFEDAFGAYFSIELCSGIRETERSIYLMRKK
ncbi:MAG: SAM-dependent methyltransferase [Dehalococcoidia bacterium]